jgi:hypothetical protein
MISEKLGTNKRNPPISHFTAQRREIKAEPSRLPKLRR